MDLESLTESGDRYRARRSPKFRHLSPSKGTKMTIQGFDRLIFRYRLCLCVCFLFIALPTTSTRATTKGLSQIVTPDLQPEGDLSLSFQWQSKQIANPYEFQGQLGLTKWFEVAVFSMGRKRRRIQPPHRNKCSSGDSAHLRNVIHCIYVRELLTIYYIMIIALLAG